MADNLFGAIAGGVSGLINTGVGIAQRHEGKKLLRNLGEQPIEEMPAEVTQNQQLAFKRSKTGLPSEQYQQAMQNIQRQQMMALRGANDRRGGLALLSSLNQGADDATLNLDVKNAQARLNNEKTLMTTNNQVAGWKSRLFGQNVLNPYMAKKNYAMSLIGTGNQNAVTGVDQLAGNAALYGYEGGFNRRRTLADNSNLSLLHETVGHNG